LKIADFNLPHLYMAPSLGWWCWNFAEIFGIRKLESLYDIVCMILRLALMGQCRLMTDGQTDIWTHDDSTY